MPKAKNVTVIPATLNIHTKTPTKERVRRRVAGEKTRERKQRHAES